jgi:hypothetical protein
LVLKELQSNPSKVFKEDKMEDVVRGKTSKEALVYLGVRFQCVVSLGHLSPKSKDSMPHENPYPHSQGMLSLVLDLKL